MDNRGDIIFKKIFVAIDGSLQSKKVLDVAFDITARYKARLSIVSVSGFHTEHPSEDTSMVPPELYKDKGLKASDLYDLINEGELNFHRRILDEAIKRGEEKGLRLKASLLKGKTSKELLKFLDENPHDLVIIGNRGMTGITKMLLGSTSSAMVRHSECSVLVVK